MRAVCTDFEVELAEFNGESNHVHLLVNVPPKVALSKLVNTPHRCVAAADAAGVPRTGSALPAGATTLVRFLVVPRQVAYGEP